MLSLFTYGLTRGVAEARSDTKELGLKLTSFQSFDHLSAESTARSYHRTSEGTRSFLQTLLRRRDGKD